MIRKWAEVDKGRGKKGDNLREKAREVPCPRRWVREGFNYELERLKSKETEGQIRFCGHLSEGFCYVGSSEITKETDSKIS